ncbi:WbuC family cupin fold metalloprotein [Salinicoccus roseus]|uniref:WbuC family cupin fold metalloprotein n=1 Tax=Salinicoccus roseus TaxID=45670 RepID=UPI00230016D7|nr:WbuC family cupin fold metalloprotein [Salinicoccus roseus]
MFISDENKKRLIRESSANESGRSHLLLHESPEDAIQEIVFCIQPSTVINVHKHKRGTETITCLQGSMAVSIFNDDVLNIYHLNKNNPVLKFNPLSWHTYTSLEKDTIGLEIKEGPYLKENFINHNQLNEKIERQKLNNTIIKRVEDDNG